MPKVHHVDEEDEEDVPEPAGPCFAYLLGRLPGDVGLKAHQLAVQHLASPVPSPDAFPAYVLPQGLAAEFQPSSDHPPRPSTTVDPEGKEQQQQAEATARPMAPHV